MTRPTDKTPKVAAIMAWNRKLLSAASQKRVSDHVAHSEDARRVAASDRVFESLVADVRDQDLPNLDWAKIDAALQPHRLAAAEEAKPSRKWYWVAGLAAAAALALVGNIRWGAATGPSAQNHAQGPKPMPAAPANAPHVSGKALAELVGEVVAVTGRVTAAMPSGQDFAVTLGTKISAGTRLTTAEASEVTVALYGHTRFTLGADAELTLAPASPLAAQHVSLVLFQGTVTSQVDKLLGSGAHYDVSIRNHQFRVMGTRFAVTGRPGGGPIDLSVAEGVVQVWIDGVLRHTVRAPGQWSSEPAAAPGPGAATESRAPPAQQNAAPTGDPVPTEPSTTATQPMAVPDLRERSVVRQGTLAPSAISPVVAAGRDGLMRCRDAASKDGDELIGRYSLRIAIAPSGRVDDAELTGDVTPPMAFRACVLRGVRSWRFPRPEGGPVNVEVPLLFATKKTK